MAKKIKIDLDEEEIKAVVVEKDELIKIKDAKFGKASKMPSLFARTMAQKMFDKPDTGNFIDTSKMDADRKKLVINTLKKELGRVAKQTNHKDIRVRTVDQGNRVVFFYAAKKKKDSEVVDKTAEKKVVGGKK